MALERTAKGWRIRLRYGSGQRRRFDMPDLPERVARARAERLAKMAERLSAANVTEAAIVLERAASQVDEASFAEIERVARELCLQAAPLVKERPPVTFGDVAELWISGEIARKWPDLDRIRTPRVVDRYRSLLGVILPVLGARPVANLTLEDAEAAKSAVPQGLAQGTRRHYAFVVRRVMALAVYPLRVIDQNPIPASFVPPQGSAPAFPFLYPSEDDALMTCSSIPLIERALYGLLDREGLRVSEALRLTWADMDLERQVITLDENKTRAPRAWRLAPEVARGLALLRGKATVGATVFPDLGDAERADAFRQRLLQCGIDRRVLHVRTKERRPMRIHDLRGTFVTLALAGGATETWVMDRTGHTTSTMVNRYRRQARHASELGLGWFGPYDVYIRMGLVEGKGAESMALQDGPQNTGCTRKPQEPARLPWLPAETEKANAPHPEPGPAGFAGMGQSSDHPLLKVEEALALALEAAVKAGRLDLVPGIVAELGERRRARTAPEVTSIERARARKESGER